MNIIKIYEKYHIPQQLQMHMLRVAACANLIIDNWQGNQIDKDAIISGSLLHDMGNMAKFQDNPDNDKEFLNVRKKYIDKFSTDDHKISLEIGRNEGLNDYELELMEKKESKRNEEIMNSSSYEIKICAYCDERVAPDGVYSIRERLEDAKRRYRGKTNTVWGHEEKANHLIGCALKIEEQIMKYCTIKPEKISNDTIEAYIKRLRDYDIDIRIDNLDAEEQER